MRCTHCSSAMTPTHTRRRGRLYRYYVCLGASRRGHDTSPVRSIAASEVEGLVLGQVRRLLASPELVARTITAMRRENSGAEDAMLEEGEVIEALGALEPVWDELYPAEQARILRLVIERIDVASDGISVTLHAAGIRSLVAELAAKRRDDALHHIVDRLERCDPLSILVLEVGDLLLIERRQPADEGRLVADVGLVKGGRAGQFRIREHAVVPRCRDRRPVRAEGQDVEEERLPGPGR